MVRLVAFFLAGGALLNTLAEDISIAWDPNTEPDLAGYHVYYGEVGQQNQTLTFSSPEATLTGLQPGHTYEIYVTAFNTLGVESAPSETIVHSVPAEPVVEKNTATVTLGALFQQFDGSRRSVSVATVPPGLAVNVTYNGSDSAPVNAGTYAVTATVEDPNYIGSATAILTIARAPATVTFTTLTRTYDGTPKSASVKTTPENLAVELFHAGTHRLPISAGHYQVIATVKDPNFTGSATGVFEIARADASITLSGLSHTSDGSPKSATAMTSPNGLKVELTYNGSSIPPEKPGTYHLVATISDFNYTGIATATFEIASPAEEPQVRIGSATMKSSDVSSAGVMKLTATGKPGETFKIHASSDLKEWVVVGRATVGANGVLEFTDSTIATSKQRFYRTELEY